MSDKHPVAIDWDVKTTCLAHESIRPTSWIHVLTEGVENGHHDTVVTISVGEGDAEMEMALDVEQVAQLTALLLKFLEARK